MASRSTSRLHRKRAQMLLDVAAAVAGASKPVGPRRRGRLLLGRHARLRGGAATSPACAAAVGYYGGGIAEHGRHGCRPCRVMLHFGENGRPHSDEPTWRRSVPRCPRRPGVHLSGGARLQLRRPRQLRQGQRRPRAQSRTLPFLRAARGLTRAFETGSSPDPESLARRLLEGHPHRFLDPDCAGHNGRAVPAAGASNRSCATCRFSEDVSCVNTICRRCTGPPSVSTGSSTLLDQMSGVEGAAPTYPPYNIERTGENAYRISVAVAGFAEKDLSIETRENALLIRGSKGAVEEGDNGQARNPLPGHCGTRVRAPLPARRPCPGDRRAA